MPKYGLGLNKEIVNAVNAGDINEPFSTADIRKFIHSKKWNPEPTELYINTTLSNASSDTHSHTYKKYFKSVGVGKFIVRQQYKEFISPNNKAPEVVSSNSELEMTFINPCHEDQYNFLIRLYFGESNDSLGSCVKRAYLDFNRTLHGISSHPDSKLLKNKASEILCSELIALRETPAIKNQEHFDSWHERVCNLLCSSYAENSFDEFRIGQAQKWLNMTFKYIFVFGEDHLPGFEKYYPYGHVPIDNIILDKLQQYRVPKLPCAWSRIDSYKEYMDFQNWIRNTFPNSTPLAVEFHLWYDPKIEVPGADMQIHYFTNENESEPTQLLVEYDGKPYMVEYSKPGVNHLQSVYLLDVTEGDDVATAFERFLKFALVPWYYFDEKYVSFNMLEVTIRTREILKHSKASLQDNHK